MSLEGKAITDYASLSGKIHTLVIDKTLSISGAAADAKAVGDKIDTFDKKVDEANKSVEQAKKDYEEAVADMDEAAAEAASNAVEGAMATILSNRTKALFGLNANAIPDEAFAFLGKYNQHWWARTAQNLATKYRYNEVQETHKYFYVWYEKCLCSDAVTINEDTGVIELVNPITPQNYQEFNSHTYCKSTGKGISITVGDTTTYNETDIFYCPPGTQSNSGTGFVRYDADRSVFKLVVESYEVNVGDSEFVYSSDRNAYPDSGISNGFEYTYLGIPFDNAVTAPKIETGSYKGTNTYGKNNPCSLTFGFVPKFIFISQNDLYTHNYRGFWCSGMGYMSGYHNTSSFSGTNVASLSGKTFSWHNPDNNANASTQLNNSTYTYCYIAIG